MQPVLIAGGGIGGLTLAIALARQGIASQVFEARERLPGEGAGIQLGPNATRILFALGLGAQLLPKVVAPECIIVNDGVSGRELARLPLGNWMEQRHGAPYWVVHRAALHEVLWSAAGAEPLIELTEGKAVTSVRDSADGASVAVDFADGGVAAGRLLVGADGLWSRVRGHVDPTFQLAYTGLMAARALVTREQVEEVESGARFTERATGVWLVPGAHVVHYPIDSQGTIAVVAIGASDLPIDGWSTAVAADAVGARFSEMPHDVRGLLAAAQDWRQWPLYRAGGPRYWSKGRVVLIGDAAHPVLPYLAQGGALAIEDGFELAHLIARRPHVDLADLVTLNGEFCRKRQGRAIKMQMASTENGRAYHATGLAAVGRNALLRCLPGGLFMRRYDWIYGNRS